MFVFAFRKTRKKNMRTTDVSFFTEIVKIIDRELYGKTESESLVFSHPEGELTSVKNQQLNSNRTFQFTV